MKSKIEIDSKSDRKIKARKKRKKVRIKNAK